MLCRVVRITQVKEQISALSVFKVHYFFIWTVCWGTDNTNWWKPGHCSEGQEGGGEHKWEQKEQRERERDRERECMRVCTPACECPGMLCSHQETFSLLGERQNFKNDLKLLLKATQVAVVLWVTHIQSKSTFQFWFVPDFISWYYVLKVKTIFFWL